MTYILTKTEGQVDNIFTLTTLIGAWDNYETAHDKMVYEADQWVSDHQCGEMFNSEEMRKCKHVLHLYDGEQAYVAFNILQF